MCGYIYYILDISHTQKMLDSPWLLFKNIIVVKVTKIWTVCMCIGVFCALEGQCEVGYGVKVLHLFSLSLTVSLSLSPSSVGLAD